MDCVIWCFPGDWVVGMFQSLGGFVCFNGLNDYGCFSGMCGLECFNGLGGLRFIQGTGLFGGYFNVLGNRVV